MLRRAVTVRVRVASLLYSVNDCARRSLASNGGGRSNETGEAGGVAGG